MLYKRALSIRQLAANRLHRRPLHYAYWLLLVLLSLFVTAGVQAQSGKQKIDSLLQQLNKLPEDSSRLGLLNRITNWYLDHEFSKVIVYATQGEAIARHYQRQKDICDFMGFRGEAYTYMGDFSKAQKIFDEEAVIAKKAGILRYVAAVESDQGLAAQMQGNYPQAQTYFFQCLSTANEMRDTVLIAVAYINICVVYFNENNFDKTIEYAQKALALDRKYTLVIVPAKANEMIGNSYLNQKNFSKARPYYLEALAIYRDAKNEMGIATMLSQLASAYPEDYRKELGYAISSDSIWRRIGPENLYAINNLGTIGNTYVDLARFSDPVNWKDLAKNKKELVDKGVGYLLKSLALARKTNMEASMLDIADSLAQIQAYRGDYKDAFLRLNRYVQLYDSTYSQSNKNKIAGIESKYQIDLRDKQLQINQLELSNQQKIRWSLIIGLALLFLIVILIARQSSLRKKSNQHLQQLNEQLAAAGKLKTQFFGILNHDLRRPMGHFINLLYLMEEKPVAVDGTAEARTRQIRDNATGLLDTIDDLLLWTKGQMENFTPQVRLVPVNDLFIHLEKLFPSPGNLRINYQFPAGMTINTDESYCQTILRNLTQNSMVALSNTPEAQIKWTAWEDADKKYISITDNGPGAQEKDLVPLFDSSSPVGIRNGLGLHVVRDMAKAIDCIVSIRSAQPKGLEVLLTFSKTA